MRGSHLYGLNTAQSDVDYGGLFVATDVQGILGFGRDQRKHRTIATTKEACDVDEAYYELRHFLDLLKRTNTQVVEALFCPDELVLETSEVFELMRKNAFRLIDTKHLAKSLFGYLQAERKLVFGENTGKLGSKRQAAVLANGYSHKNAVQYMRLAFCGYCMLTRGEYPVNLKDKHQVFWQLLMNVKTNPQNYTAQQVSGFMDDAYALFEHADKAPQFHSEFDHKFADELLLMTYTPILNTLFTK